MNAYDSVRPLRWVDSRLQLLDQRRLPLQAEYVDCYSALEVAESIKEMVVRGAPAIGIAAAYGVVLAAKDAYARAGQGWREAIADALRQLANARPTAVNLHWALARMERRMATLPIGDDPYLTLLDEARKIQEEDLAANLYMGEQGAALMHEQGAVLTHCNTGSLATAGYGTALGVIRSAYAQGKITEVFADETRPWLQGARLTAWELKQDGIPVKLIADAAAAFLMKQANVQWVVVGADRITANGDVANKIGTYGLALAARAHGVKFMVVAPSSTIDWEMATGADIPIESRMGDELLAVQGQRVAVEGVDAWNPVFDVTPAEYVDVLVTERGVVHRPSREHMAALR
ncbi:S-methyl-5-thioribose-1-phosphate isomerase [Alkalilimnicola ehrlichii]|uniref:Methylthioribose-1-phosphate isomerase n=1 Tax=Alkalilimnicola ehrlichii TaxID=351052 RepID=A0A3E0WVB2_9GAMM|nr:S-methyl-5-thioribose-1-phosphate isomerase [Alkalilimnicola ehrlichii]RFA27751.1 S-methyl-5-thioribose-1-phosphate isomerase [Alkalilimnicola ehrlichii]RFA36914.1 S-methyl-5-thioribose-1-phosphate isomerase [Alkalilimnicola ehrlichii]